MSCILVAIANPERLPLEAGLIAELGARFDAMPRWLAEGEAADMAISGHDPADVKTIASYVVGARGRPLDLAVLPAGCRRKRLLISDMDSTMITVECIDELADFAGVNSDVAAITRRAMNGELDFAGALRERVALLAGLPIGVIDEVYAERVRPMPGARILVQTMRRFGAVTALVSGGFVPFVERVADALGFETRVANRLEIADGRLTGRVLPPITGADTKLSTLRQLLCSHDLRPDEALAVGDGANDLPMITAAGLGVAFRPHAALAAASDVVIRTGDLTALLYLQGVPKDEFFVK
ncbi:MAG: phosphoserine phosphatase SerB [Alphaproteobacteria bacterium]|nr:phosphoserine phosphatase SerB [Alphaproteobacteria bacterium]